MGHQFNDQSEQQMNEGKQYDANTKASPDTDQDLIGQSQGGKTERKKKDGQTGQGQAPPAKPGR